jgi:hypothetical protein
VAGREWGFYLATNDALAIELHAGEVPVAEAVAFVCRVAEVVASGSEFTLVVQGTTA